MYQILIKKRAKRFIDKLPARDKRRVVEAIERLPEGDDIKKLRGYEGVLHLRVGSYRIIYEVDDDRLIVTVIDAGN